MFHDQDAPADAVAHASPRLLPGRFAARAFGAHLKNRHFLDKRTSLLFSVCSREFSYGIPPRRHAEYGRALIFPTPHVSSRDRRGSANERRAGGEGRQRMFSPRGRRNPLKRLKTVKEIQGNPKEIQDNSKEKPRNYEGIQIDRLRSAAAPIGRKCRPPAGGRHSVSVTFMRCGVWSGSRPRRRAVASATW